MRFNDDEAVQPVDYPISPIDQPASERMDWWRVYGLVMAVCSGALILIVCFAPMGKAKVLVCALLVVMLLAGLWGAAWWVDRKGTYLDDLEGGPRL